ncbi:hypothetical protein [Candidatus Phytoplasma fraxini]
MYFNPEEYDLQEVFLKPSFIEEMIIKGREYQALLKKYQALMTEAKGASQ